MCRRMWVGFQMRPANTARVFSKYLTNSEVRNRMRRINATFVDYPQYFGYGIYSFTKT